MFGRRLRDDYHIGAELGRGAFGVVRCATRRSDGAEAAVKSLERKRIDLSALRREVDVLRAVAQQMDPIIFAIARLELDVATSRRDLESGTQNLYSEL